MKIVSAVFHPLLIATYLGAFLSVKTPELFPTIQPEARLPFIGVIFLITFLMPVFSMLLLRTFKYVSDMEMMMRKERIIPFAFIVFYYAAASYLFTIKLDIGTLFQVVIISVTVLIFLLLIITIWFKISIHSAAIWSCAGYITGIVLTQSISLGVTFYLIFVAAGLTSTSRLYLGYHSPKEVWAGAILGFGYSLGITLLIP